MWVESVILFIRINSFVKQLLSVDVVVFLIFSVNRPVTLLHVLTVDHKKQL